LSQDTSAQLESTIHEISRTVPRLTYDLQFMRESAAGLRGSLHAIETQSPASGVPAGRFLTDGEAGDLIDGGQDARATAGAGPDPKTKAVLERLEYLDTVKTGMEATLAVLQEAESWSTLEAEITALLGEAQYLKAATRLAESSKFVTLFTPATSEFEARRSLLVSLQNQLEASLSTALVRAVGDKDREACRSYWEIFGMIAREDEFRGYYYGARRARLVDDWAAAALVDGEGSGLKAEATGADARPVPFADFLAMTWFGALRTLLQEEMSFLPAVFPDPVQTLNSLVQSIFDNLAPSFAQRLESLAEFHGAGALPELIKCYKATEQLAVFVQATMEKLTATPKPPNSPILRSPAAGASHGRRDSRRLSAYSISIPRGGSIGSLDGSSTAAGHSLEPGPWESALFEPFVNLQAEYAALERRFVLAQLESDAFMPSSGTNSDSSAGGGDLARGVGEKWAAVLDLLEGSSRRALDLTHGYAATGLIKVVNEAAAYFLARIGKLVQARTAQRPVKPKAIDGDDLDELNYDGMDYTTEDLAMFQLALHLLGTCRQMRDRLGAFETELVRTLSAAASRFLGDRDEPAKGVVLEGTTRGAVGMLQQSTLNSRDLHELFDALHVGAVKEPATGPGGRPSLPGHTSSSSSFASHHLRAPSFFPPTAGAGAPPANNGHAHHASLFGGSGGASSFPPPAARLPPPLLDPARGALRDFVVLTQAFLQQTILAPLFQLLSTYPALSAFRAPGGASRGRPKTLANVPTFSLSPTETISHVGEGLLNLPRLFEVYAVDDALSFSIETLPFISASLLGASSTNGPQSGPPLSSPGTVSPSDRSPLSSPALAKANNQILSTDLSAERVTALHLQSLTSTLLAHLLATTLTSFPVLSPAGVEQLATDLGYLANVVRSVDVDWKEGEELASLLSKPETDLRVGGFTNDNLVCRVRTLRGLDGAAGLSP